jgi:hypothetical protein
LEALSGRLAGHAAENEGRLRDGVTVLPIAGYLGSGLSAVFENWESEFLQMWAYVMLTAYLFQRGLPESRDPDGDEERPGEGPGALKTLGHKLYAHSLGLALFALFVLSFLLHWMNSTRHAAEKALQSGDPAPTMPEYFGDPQLWFESFQNWQSEFLSTAVLIVLGIFSGANVAGEQKRGGTQSENRRLTPQFGTGRFASG